MKELSTDERLNHLLAVLEGKAEPAPDELPVVARLAELSKAPDFDVPKGYRKLMAEIALRREKERRRRRRRRMISLGTAAAALVGFLALVLLPGRRDQPQSGGLSYPLLAEQIREQYLLPDSLAGRHDLMLVRADGTRMHLRLGDRDTLRLEELVPLLSPDEEVTIIVPEMRRGTVLLEDGTVVSLNSVSSLRTPATFGSGERHVTLEEGEALMQVAHDAAHPFGVELREMRLEVLGTTFDICLYPEQQPSAALLEGSLRVTDRAGRSLLLEPGEEAVADAEEGLLLRQVDGATRTAWVDGVFVFSHLPLSAIMTYLGRWYGFETTYTDESLREQTFTGALRRAYSRDFVFDLLETTTQLQITTNPNNQPDGERLVVVSAR